MLVRLLLWLLEVLQKTLMMLNPKDELNFGISLHEVEKRYLKCLYVV
jgi:hypothetical protein